MYYEPPAAFLCNGGVEFRHVSSNQLGQASIAAKAAVAAHRQGRFWAMHGKLFELQGSTNRAVVEHTAQELGLDMDAFRRDLDSGTAKAVVDRDTAFAAARQIKGTPKFVVNGKELIAWSYESFKAEIDAAGSTSANGQVKSSAASAQPSQPAK
jgi:predicted DsbA family dithiol-disulfide isomerase